jgi:hypothetical protein
VTETAAAAAQTLPFQHQWLLSRLPAHRLSLPLLPEMAQFSSSLQPQPVLLCLLLLLHCCQAPPFQHQQLLLLLLLLLLLSHCCCQEPLSQHLQPILPAWNFSCHPAWKPEWGIWCY